MPRFRSPLAYCFPIISLFASLATAGDWPRWRGPDNTGWVPAGIAVPVPGADRAKGGAFGPGLPQPGPSVLGGAFHGGLRQVQPRQFPETQRHERQHQKERKRDASVDIGRKWESGKQKC